MAEPAVSAFLRVLLEKLTSPELLNFATHQEGVRSELQKWEETLKMIEALLIDAQEKQLTNEAVKTWLEDLQDLAFDAEDILDAYATEASRRKLKVEEDQTITSRAGELNPELKTEEDQTTTSRGRKLIPELKIEEDQTCTSWVRKLILTCCSGVTPSTDFRIHDTMDDEEMGPLDDVTGQSALWSNFSIRSDIDDEKMGPLDDITGQLEDLYEQRNDLGLLKTAGGRPTVSSQSALTTFVPTEPAFYGRDEDKAKVLELVLRHESDDTNFGVVSIVGVGGIGKTTLAQEVYNDEAVKDFNLKAWVRVSADFDDTKISIAILESIMGITFKRKYAFEPPVQDMLADEVAGRKFLLVLDDVWSEDYSKWEILKSPFMLGAQGSKIIVTTRSENVALTMGRSDKCHRLIGLSDNACWSLFSSFALYNDVVGPHPSEIIHQKVIDKCKGLPLAARSLGGLLRSKNINEWLDILNSKTWELLDKSEIPTALQISYYHLPSHLKRCFIYCGILPKDYEFEKKELVLLWMAEGLIQQSSDDKQLEELGGEYFHDLLSRSIFQISSRDSSKFIMHDLVNDLAKMVSRKLSFELEDELESNTRLRILKGTRYASHICHQFDGKRIFDVFSDAKHLRAHLSILPINNRVKTHYISNCVIPNLLSRFKKLRALSLQKYCIFELPDSIGSLRHLRYLNLSDSRIRNLPESVTSIWNLQTLLLRNCSRLLKWPNSMEDLSNLRHFDILGASSIKEMPKGIRKWECLRTLSNFIVGRDSRSSLKDLKDLKFLCGELHILRLENVTNPQDIGNVIFDKKDLKILLLEWESVHYRLRDKKVHNEVFDILQPHENIEKLTIKGYGGTDFSSWVRSNSFSKSNMTILELVDCNTCTSLPSLGLLDSLRNLTIKGMKELERIGSEFYGENCLNPFKSLETLYIKNLKKCGRWDHVKEHESFPKLQELSIVKCPKLSQRLPNNLSLLKKLVVRECEQLVVSLSNIPTICKLELSKCKKVVFSGSTFSESLESMTFSSISNFGDWSNQSLKKVRSLDIEGCEDLIELWQNEILLKTPSQGLHSLTSINKLKFENCRTLTSLLEGIKQKNVGIEELRIWSCDSLNSIFRGQLPQSLKKLNIGNCKELQRLLADNNNDTSVSSTMEHSLEEIPSATILQHREKVNANTSHLEDLSISWCPSLTCLPSVDQLSGTLTRLGIYECSKLTTLSLPVALEHLEIQSCSELTTLSSEGRLPKTLKTIFISRCSKLESIVEKFHNNEALYKIYIRDCLELKSLPKGLETLSMLRSIGILHCDKFAFSPNEAFPNSNLSLNQKVINENLRVWIKGCIKFYPRLSYGDLRVHLRYCPKLEALPSGIHSLCSLTIDFCSKMSFSEEDLPTILTELTIDRLPQYKELMERGFHNFTSLTYLAIFGDHLGRREPDTEITLPPNLTWMWIASFRSWKCLPFKDFGGLSSLKILQICQCPQLTSLPSILPSSLLRLEIWECPSLKAACRRDKGKEWPKIADIPYVEISREFIYDPEE